MHKWEPKGSYVYNQQGRKTKKQKKTQRSQLIKLQFKIQVFWVSISVSPYTYAALPFGLCVASCYGDEKYTYMYIL